MRRHISLAGLCAAWIGLAAFAPPPEPAVLEYAIGGLTGPASAGPNSAASFEDPAEQPSAPDRTSGPDAEQRPTAPVSASPRAKIWSLSIDAGITADSNVTNGSTLDTIAVDTGGLVLPIPLDPRLRERDGIGLGLSAAADLRLPVADDLWLLLDAEAYVLDHQEGDDADDSALLLAAGGEASVAGGQGSLQLIAFDRWYGGISASKGVGLRGHYRRPVGEGGSLSLDIDARIFESDYGDDFGGREASLYLAYQAPLSPNLSGSLGMFARREWLDADSFSSMELGLYGGLNRYLSSDLTGGVSAGISRLRFDGPILFLSPDPRRDWHAYASVYLATRRPLAWGVWPSVTYTYNRSDSSIAFYRTDRHRLRLGLTRRF
jgi:hypothetical protein